MKNKTKDEKIVMRERETSKISRERRKFQNEKKISCKTKSEGKDKKRHCPLYDNRRKRRLTSEWVFMFKA